MTNPLQEHKYAGKSTLLNALIVDSESPPVRPVVTYIGTEGYSTNDLSFVTSEFTDLQGTHTFAALA